MVPAAENLENKELSADTLKTKNAVVPWLQSRIAWDFSQTKLSREQRSTCGLVTGRGFTEQTLIFLNVE